MEQVELVVKQMGCGACVARVTQALRNVLGVQVVRVEVGRAVIHRDASVASDDQILNALRDVGYPSTREGLYE